MITERGIISLSDINSDQGATAGLAGQRCPHD